VTGRTVDHAVADLRYGYSQPLGATPTTGGVNFSVYSEHATRVELLLFDSTSAQKPSRVIELDPAVNRTFHFWHIHVSGLRSGQVYAYRMDGPGRTALTGFRFDPAKVLLDPYARGNVNNLWDRGRAVGPGDNADSAMRSVVIDTSGYDWEGDVPLRTPMADTVVYEMHVRGFTRSPSSGVANPGTFSGIVEKIPYLVSLGVTAVELMPIFDFDESQVLRQADDGKSLRNYWGYDPFGFFAPQSSYCVAPDEGQHITEFRDMVKALHAAGIEVILDVVFNHTSEGNENGPVISFRGQANEAYYHLWSMDRRCYENFSGCGNTLNANHPVVNKMIIDCLEYWVREHHVDGFRFDLASVLDRDLDGSEMATPPVLWNIELADQLADTKIIAEPWDAGGLYQVGRFPGRRWSEWNGPFRDEVRRFVRGDPGLVGAVASRVGGSADLFEPEDELPTNSVNFITAHDGFTLNDLVSYQEKHNAANGEDSRDGSDANYSWNCGAEGPTEDRDVEDLRLRQIKNFASILLLSRGVPMLLMGDEVRRTQQGNNNAYCIDGPLTWFDWDQVDDNADVLRFFSELIALRKRNRVLRMPRFLSDRPNERGVPEVSWHGTALGGPGWDDPSAQALSCTLGGVDDEPDLHLIFNMYHLGLDFELPPPTGHHWCRAIDTSLPAPEDVLPAGSEAPVSGPVYQASGRSVVVLVSHPAEKEL
jgi:isoamylase